MKLGRCVRNVINDDLSKNWLANSERDNLNWKREISGLKSILSFENRFKLTALIIMVIFKLQNILQKCLVKKKNNTQLKNVVFKISCRVVNKNHEVLLSVLP